MIDGKSTCHKVLGECREERLLKSLKHHVLYLDIAGG